MVESATILTNEKAASACCPDLSKWLYPLEVIHFESRSNEETVNSFTEPTFETVKLYADTWSRLSSNVYKGTLREMSVPDWKANVSFLVKQQPQVSLPVSTENQDSQTH